MKRKEQATSELSELSEIKKLLQEIGDKLEFGNKQFLTRKDLATYLQVSPMTICQYIYKKIIPFYKSPTGRVYFDKKEIDEWIRTERITTDEDLLTQAYNHELKSLY